MLPFQGILFSGQPSLEGTAQELPATASETGEAGLFGSLLAQIRPPADDSLESGLIFAALPTTESIQGLAPPQGARLTGNPLPDTGSALPVPVTLRNSVVPFVEIAPVNSPPAGPAGLAPPEPGVTIATGTLAAVPPETKQPVPLPLAGAAPNAADAIAADRTPESAAAAATRNTSAGPAAARVPAIPAVPVDAEQPLPSGKGAMPSSTPETSSQRDVHPPLRSAIPTPQKTPETNPVRTDIPGHRAAALQKLPAADAERPVHVEPQGRPVDVARTPAAPAAATPAAAALTDLRPPARERNFSAEAGSRRSPQTPAVAGLAREQQVSLLREAVPAPEPIDRLTMPAEGGAERRPLPAIPPATTAVGASTAQPQAPTAPTQPVPSFNLAPPVLDPAWQSALGERVLWMAGNQVKNAELRLNPAELGPLQVQVSVDDRGVNVSITAAHAVTREALESALPRLRELLADSGMQLADANVSGEERRGDETADARELPEGVESEHTAGPGSMVVEPEPDSRRPTGRGIDIFA